MSEQQQQQKAEPWDDLPGDDAPPIQPDADPLDELLKCIGPEQFAFLEKLINRLRLAKGNDFTTAILNAVLCPLGYPVNVGANYSTIRKSLGTLKKAHYAAVNGALCAALGVSPEEPEPPKARETWDHLRKGWVYVGQQKQFVRLDDRKMWDVPAFDNQFNYVCKNMGGHGKPPTVLSKAIFACMPGTGLPTYDSFAFMPGKPENVRNLFNSWRKSNIEAAPGNTDLWDAHLEYLFADPKERAHVLDWLAWVYKHQGEHPHHALLTHGAMQGTGKSFIFQVLSHLLGVHNTTLLDQTALDLPHDKWKVATKLLLIEEVRPAFGSSNATVKKLHPLISQDTMHVDMKNAHDFDMPNVMAMGLGSNKSDAMSMDNSDRRYLIVSTDSGRDAPLLPKPDAYYDALYGLLRDSHAVAAIGQALLDRDLGSYSGKHRAPFTTAKAAMMEASAGDLEKWMIENADSRPLCYSLVTVQEILDALPKDIKPERGARERVGDILEHKLKGENLGKVRLGGRLSEYHRDRPRLWALHKRTDKPMAGVHPDRVLAERYRHERGDFTPAEKAKRAAAMRAAAAEAVADFADG